MPMKTNFTQKALIRFIYGETNFIESEMIQKEIKNDWYLKEEYQLLKNTLSSLDLKLTPSDASIDFVMAYSRRSQLTTI